MAAANHQTKIGIDSTRAKQLRAIADHHDVCVSELIDEFTRRQWKKIGQQGLPGFVVECAGNGIIFETDNDLGTLLFREDAITLAKAITAATNGKSIKFKTTLGHLFIVGRKGRGLTMILSKDGETAWQRGLSNSLAADIANLLLCAAKEIAA